MSIKKILKKVDFKKNSTKGILAFIVATVLSFGIIVYGGQTNAFAHEFYWSVNVGDSEIVAVSTEQEANDIKDQFLKTCLTDGSKVSSLICDPEITTEENILDEVLVSEKEDYVHSTQEGVNVLLQKANEPGFIKIKTAEVVTTQESISYQTETVEDDSLPAGTSEVQTEGENGLKEVTTEYVKDNGKVIASNVISSKTIKEPVTEVIIEGTSEDAEGAIAEEDSSCGDSELGSVSYSGTGQDVANYALQFVGNPYVYGGTSLTNGCDCSGFVMSVYAHFGVSLPHGAIDMQSYGTGVSESEAMPGDIVCYPAHCAIYIGNGQVVHAMDENHGIVVTDIHYNTEVVTIRRIFT